MKLVLYILFFIGFIGQAQCKTEIIKIILEEHINRELPRLKLKKEDLIIIVNVSDLDNEDWHMSIDASPLNTFPNYDDIITINDVRIKIYYNNISKKFKKNILKSFKRIKEKREIKIEEIYRLTHYRGESTFQVNKHNEIFILATPDDEYYIKKFKERKLKFSKDLKLSKDLY